MRCVQVDWGAMWCRGRAVVWIPSLSIDQSYSRGQPCSPAVVPTRAALNGPCRPAAVGQHTCLLYIICMGWSCTWQCMACTLCLPRAQRGQVLEDCSSTAADVRPGGGRLAGPGRAGCGGCSISWGCSREDRGAQHLQDCGWVLLRLVPQGVSVAVVSW